MMDIGREHVAVDNMQNSPRNVTMRKSPLAPLCQSGEFEMDMRGKIETRAKDDKLVEA
jgi:hypothetical protein